MTIPSLKILMFDTETTGLWLGKKSHPDIYQDQYHFEQPWPVQIAACLFDLAADDFGEQFNVLTIPPEGVIFGEKAVEIHGHSEEQVRTHGRDTAEVLKELREWRKQAAMVSAFNLQFDERIIRTTQKRLGIEGEPILGTPGKDISHVCAMQMAITHFRGHGKLSKVYEKLTGQVLENAHDAMADTIAAAHVLKILILKTMGG